MNFKNIMSIIDLFLTTFSFNKLPPELQSKIIRENIKGVESLLISKNITKSVLPQFLLEECLNPICDREIREYIKKKNTTQMYCQFNHTNQEFLGSVYNNLNCCTRDIYLKLHKVLPTEQSDNNSYFSLQSHNKFSMQTRLCILDRTTKILYDLITIYNILCRRISCLKVNQSFAKKATIDLFNKLYESTVKENNISSLSYFLVFLMGNAHIMDIQIDNVSKHYINKETIRCFIDSIVPDIRNRLFNLDETESTVTDKYLIKISRIREPS